MLQLGCKICKIIENWRKLSNFCVFFTVFGVKFKKFWGGHSLGQHWAFQGGLELVELGYDRVRSRLSSPWYTLNFHERSPEAFFQLRWRGTGGLPSLGAASMGPVLNFGNFKIFVNFWCFCFERPFPGKKWSKLSKFGKFFSKIP